MTRGRASPCAPASSSPACPRRANILSADGRGLAFRYESRNQLVAEIREPFVPCGIVELGKRVEQRVGVVEEHLGCHSPARWPFGLVIEPGYLSVLFEFDHAVAGGLFPRHLRGHHRESRTALSMAGDHVGIVGLVHVIGGEDEYERRIESLDQLPIALESVGVPLVPATLAVPEVRVDDTKAPARAVEIPRATAGELT